MTQPAIDVTDLDYAYGDNHAVRGISFQVHPGEVLGFLGPNGAGKSTTIKMLTGLLQPRSGRVTMLGRDVSRGHGGIQSRIGVCFEEKNLYEDMTAHENLHFYGKLFGIKSLDTRDLLARVDLADRANDRVESFSKGMRQRLMLARSLVNQPDVLFLDEPTDGLDPLSSQAIRALIKREAERGAAVLLTTHDMAEADELSDRVAFLNEGKLYALDTPERLKLEHGQRSVTVRLKRDDQVEEQRIDLDEPGAGKKLEGLVGDAGLMTIHTEEATLEQIFIKMTGRGLEG